MILVDSALLTVGVEVSLGATIHHKRKKRQVLLGSAVKYNERLRVC